MDVIGLGLRRQGAEPGVQRRRVGRAPRMADDITCDAFVLTENKATSGVKPQPILEHGGVLRKRRMHLIRYGEHVRQICGPHRPPLPFGMTR